MLDYINKHGGAEEFVVGANEERTPEEELFARRFRRMMGRAEEGWLGFFESDRVCIDILGVHPSVVFGPQWIDTPEDTQLQDRLFGRNQKEDAA